MDLEQNPLARQANADVDAQPSVGGSAANDTCKRAQLPHGFRYDADGWIEKKDKGSDAEWTRFCSPIEILARTRDAANQNWGLLIRVRDQDGIWHQFSVPMTMLAGDAAEILKMLMSSGLLLGSASQDRKSLLQLLLNIEPTGRARCVEQVGWHGDVFVLPDRTIGANGEESVVFQSPSGIIRGLGSNGTLEEWMERVARLCDSSDRLVFSLAAAFAPPLLAPLNEESGGFHFRGPSSIGKTTALTVAGSVWGGGGAKGFVQSWRATDNGLEAVAAGHCDLLLPLDEMSQVDPEVAGEVAYMLANGQGKQRAARDGMARRPNAWRTLFLSTGEIGISDKLSEARGRKKIMAGQEIRVLDIPADAGKGLGIFDSIPDGVSAGELAQKLGEAARRAYGAAGIAFVEQLVCQKELVAKEGRQFIDRFVGEVARDCDGQVQRAAKRFALVAFAGELAIRWGILPFELGAAVAAAKSCFDAWHMERGFSGPAEIERGIRAVAECIQKCGASKFTPKDEPNKVVPDRLGCRDRAKFMIFNDRWPEVCGGYNPKGVARELAKRGILITDSQGKLTRPERLPGFDKPIRVHVIDANALLGERDDE